MLPLDLNGLKTYDLQSRPSKVFIDDLGRPTSPHAAIGDWIDTLPKQLAANELRRLRDHLCRCHTEGRTVAAAIGGHVIKVGCAPYLIDWIEQGIIKAVAMNGSAAIHDFELAYAGKTSEDVAAQLPSGAFGMARETADAFAVASRIGSENELGLGAALGRYIDEMRCPHASSSIIHAAWNAGIPCTIHVALGTAYPESGGKNRSGLHWDMVCDLRQGGRIFADGEVISENGKFVNSAWPQPRV